MILGPDKKKLSKRHSAESVMEYKEMGYLPEALVSAAWPGWAGPTAIRRSSRARN